MLLDRADRVVDLSTCVRIVDALDIIPRCLLDGSDPLLGMWLITRARNSRTSTVSLPAVGPVGLSEW